MKTLAAAALVAIGLMAFSPMDSIASVPNGGYNNECPTNGNNNHKVPEPGTMALLGAAIGAIYLKARKSAE